MPIGSAPDEPQAGSEPKPIVPKNEGDNEKAIVDAVMGHYTDSSRARIGRESLWMDCLAYHAGDQTKFWSNQDNRYMDEFPRMATYRSRHVENAIEPATDQVVSLLTATKPALVASPASGDFEDTSISEVGTAILDKLRETMNFSWWDQMLKRRKFITGTAALEVEWDPTAKPFEIDTVPKTAPDPVTGEEVPTGEETVAVDENDEPRFKPNGNFRFSFRSELETYLDPTSPFYDRWRYIITVDTADKKELERQYGVKIGDPEAILSRTPSDSQPAGTRTALLLRQAAQYYGGLGGINGWQTIGPGLERAGTTVVRMHIAPSPDFPQGRLIVVAGDKLLYDDISPTMGYFRFPVFVFYHRFTGQSCYGDGVVKSLLAPQRELNKTIRQMIEHRELSLRSKWVVDRACNIEQEAITAEPGEIVFYDSSNGGVGNNIEPPRQVQPTPIPETLFTLRANIYETIDRISGIFEAQRGEVPTGVKTGKGLQVLNNQTQVRLSTVVKQDFQVWKDIGRYLLWMTSQYWPDGEKIKYTGRNLQPCIAAFDKALFSVPVDVSVGNDEGLPQEPGERQAVLTAIFAKDGVMYAPPDIRKMYFKAAKLNDLGGLVDEENADEVNTRRKLMLIMQGQPQTADYYEDHPTCRRVLAKYMKQKDFYDLPPNIRQLTIALDQSHAVYLSGAPVPPPGSPPPLTPDALQAQASVMPAAPTGSAPKAKTPQL